MKKRSWELGIRKVVEEEDKGTELRGCKKEGRKVKRELRRKTR